MLESIGNDSIRSKQGNNNGFIIAPKSPLEIFALQNSSNISNPSNTTTENFERKRKAAFDLYNKDPMWQALYDNLGK